VGLIKESGNRFIPYVESYHMWGLTYLQERLIAAEFNIFTRTADSGKQDIYSG